jgi:hypothetical protein
MSACVIVAWAGQGLPWSLSGAWDPQTPPTACTKCPIFETGFACHEVIEKLPAATEQNNKISFEWNKQETTFIAYSLFTFIHIHTSHFH